MPDSDSECGEGHAAAHAAEDRPGMRVSKLGQEYWSGYKGLYMAQCWRRVYEGKGFTLILVH